MARSVLNKKEERKQAVRALIHLSLDPDCVHSRTSCLTLLISPSLPQGSDPKAGGHRKAGVLTMQKPVNGHV